MPWNEPGRQQDPWKGGGDQRPPELDEVLANLQRQMRRFFGGGGNNNRGDGDGGGFALGPILIIAVLVWAVFNSFHIIDAAERGVVLRFGEYNRTLQPGLRFTFPSPVETLTKVNVSELRSFEDQGRMLTGNENLIDINFAVQYRISNPEHFLFEVRSPSELLAQTAESAIREVVGANDMDFILEQGRAEIASEARALLQESLNLYEAGIELTSFNLQDVKPPPQVQDAFDDVVKAREDQARYVNEAEAYANQVIPESRGQAARVLQEAEAYRDAKIALATGEANRFELLLTEYLRAPEVTRQRLYLETMEEVLQRTPKLMLDANDVNPLLYMPMDQSGNSSRAMRALPPADASRRDGTASRNNSQDPRNRGREGR
ncbi:MAG: FtsH protease activity modulator HflK [Wenzhouxiangellaceae bacterium]